MDHNIIDPNIVFCEKDNKILSDNSPLLTHANWSFDEYKTCCSIIQLSDFAVAIQIAQSDIEIEYNIKASF